MGKTLTALRDLAGRAAAWLGRSGAAPRRTTTTVEVDRFDTETWTEVREAAPEVEDLQHRLGQRFNYAADLVGDMFAATYKTQPRLRGPDQIEPGREVNRQVMAAMIDTPELVELRSHTAGDPWAAAMAVLASEPRLRELLEQTEEAAEAQRRAAAAEAAARAAAQRLAESLGDAQDAADESDAVPGPKADAVETAIGNAEAAANAAESARSEAEAALAQAQPAIRAGAHHVLRAAAETAAEATALARAWGIEPGTLARLDFAKRAELADRLYGARLARFADLIGRFRSMAEASRARHVEGAPGELVGVVLGDDLARMVPAETANLAHPALRAAWAARYAEAHLALFRTRGTERAGKGAIIACIDCSYSMAERGPDGITAEAWAKALALALLDQARSQRRDFTAILFSSADEIAEFAFPAAETPDPIASIEMTEHFFGGGTDFDVPLTRAAEIIETEHEATGKTGADIVFITDGHADVDPTWAQTWHTARERLAFRTFAVGIGPDAATGPGSVLEALADNTRTIDDLTDTRPAADLFGAI